MRTARVNFDHQSGAEPLPEVLAAMEPWMRHTPNPGRFHREALSARQALAAAREQLASFLKADSPEQIIFTSSATEALNLAVKGCAWASQSQGRHIIFTATEQAAIRESIRFLEGQGFVTTKLGVDAEGRISPEAVRAAMRADTILICVHHANLDLGTIQDVSSIGAVARDAGVPLLVDAVASGGWLPLDVEQLGASLLVVSPHTFGGPRGVGVLYRHRRARLTSLLHGGGQEGGRRAGAENIASIAGAGISAQTTGSTLPSRADHARVLTTKLWAELHQAMPEIKLNGPVPGPGRVPNNLNISVPNVEAEGMAIALDMRGFAVASGSSCLGKSLKIPPALEAIGCPPSHALGNLILTLDWSNTSEEIERFVKTLREVVSLLRV
ncbi:MAG TPA: cysteine desulfurase family protein [Methylomirabilota bacterium]|nr:cysteine desulfurase family protein [Methylomirabilota bacterium]